MEANPNSTTEIDSIRIIKEVNQRTTYTWIFTKMGNSIWFLLEFICYFLLLGLVIFALYLPSGQIIESQQVAENITVETNVQVKEIIEFFVILKLLVGILGLFMLVPARLFRKLRKNNNLLKELNDITGKFLKDYKLK